MGTRDYPAFSDGPDGTVVRIKVHPRSRANELAEFDSEIVRVKLTAPPVEGKANRALVQFISKTLGIPQRDVEVVSGVRSRQKTIKIVGMSVHEVLSRLSRQEK